MRAARYHGAGDVRVEELDPGVLDENDVRIAVEYCGICGTDLSEYTDGPTAVPGKEPHPVTGATLPVRLGHEFAGRITETGDAVEHVGVDDRVAVNPIVPCLECTYCRQGQYRLCEDISNVGLHGNGGGFAETSVVPATNVVPLPAEVPFEHGALVEPLAVGLHAVRRSAMKPGDRVAVFGAGSIGIAVTQAARVAGARQVIVSEPRPRRRAIAESLGASRTVDPTDGSPVESIRDATGQGVDVAFEVAGLEQTVDQAIRSTKKGGETIQVGAAMDASISPNADFVLTERSYQGSFAYECVPYSADGEFGAVIQYLRDGRFVVDPMITAVIGLSELVEAGFDPLLAEDTEHLKILVDPTR